MQLSFVHISVMLLTIAIVLGGGIWASRSVKSAEGYSLGGRKAGAGMVAGVIAGTVVGGGATVGTAQLAFSVGLPAWWFTLGSGIAMIILGLFYARPLRSTALTTIPQYLVLNYGKNAGTISSVISSVGILLSGVASCLPGIQIISAMLDLSPWPAAIVLIVLNACYVFFGGMKSAGVGGILKMAVIWLSLCIAGFAAFDGLPTGTAFQATFPELPWCSLFGRGMASAMANLFSLIVGIVCTQTYIQAIFSASDPRTASIGAFVAALIVIPVGLPSVAIGMYMHAFEPATMPILVLPTFLTEHVPSWLGGIALGGIMLSLIGSISGLSLGIGTMLTNDILAKRLNVTDEKVLLKLSRFVVLGVMLFSCIIAILNLGSQVLMWNYLSMALRGGGIFLPLTLAVFMPNRINRKWAVASMLLSTLTAVACGTVISIPVSPLFVGLAVSAIMMVPAYLLGEKQS